MIPAFNAKDFCSGSKLLDMGLNLLRSAERIACSLNEQHRLADVFQMLHSKFRRLTGRVKWIPEKYQTSDLVDKRFLLFSRDDLRSDPPAHRLSTNNQTIV